MLSAVYAECLIKTPYAECCGAECRYAQCRATVTDYRGHNREGITIKNAAEINLQQKC